MGRPKKLSGVTIYVIDYLAFFVAAAEGSCYKNASCCAEWRDFELYIYIAIIYSFTVAKWLCKMTDWLMALASRHTLPRIPNSQARRAESMRICWHLILINYSIRPILGTPPWLVAFARCFRLGLVRVR